MREIQAFLSYVREHNRTVSPDIGRRLAELRRHTGYSQQALAKALGVTKGTIKHWEHGRARMDFDRLVEIAELLGYRLATLLEPPGSPLPPKERKARRRTAAGQGEAEN